MSKLILTTLLLSGLCLANEKDSMTDATPGAAKSEAVDKVFPVSGPGDLEIQFKVDKNREPSELIKKWIDENELNVTKGSTNQTITEPKPGEFRIDTNNVISTDSMATIVKTMQKVEELAKSQTNKINKDIEEAERERLNREYRETYNLPEVKENTKQAIVEEFEG